jgi:hypothetical protein
MGGNLKGALAGGIPELARQVSKQLDGLSPNIIELVVAIVVNDTDQISCAIKGLASEVKLDPDMLEAMTTLVM